MTIFTGNMSMNPADNPLTDSVYVQESSDGDFSPGVLDYLLETDLTPLQLADGGAMYLAA